MDEKKIKMSMVKKFPIAKTNAAHADVHVECNCNILPC